MRICICISKWLGWSYYTLVHVNQTAHHFRTSRIWTPIARTTMTCEQSFNTPYMIEKMHHVHVSNVFLQIHKIGSLWDSSMLLLTAFSWRHSRSLISVALRDTSLDLMATAARSPNVLKEPASGGLNTDLCIHSYATDDIITFQEIYSRTPRPAWTFRLKRRKEQKSENDKRKEFFRELFG